MDFSFFIAYVWGPVSEKISGIGDDFLSGLLMGIAEAVKSFIETILNQVFNSAA
jgi:hypothetical protein